MLERIRKERSMQGIAVGSNVRVAERPELEAYLRSPDPRDRSLVA